MISRFKSLIKKVVGISTTNIECSIDEEIVDCKEIDAEPYVGIPAGILNPVDDWFSTPYNTEVNITPDIVTGEPLKMDPVTGDYVVPTAEPENIHEVMYQEATKNGMHWKQGGSETFQGNVNLDDRTWQSGTGWSQYR